MRFIVNDRDHEELRIIDVTPPPVIIDVEKIIHRIAYLRWMRITDVKRLLSEK